MNAKGKVIATDLDGTLFFPKKKIRMLNSVNKKFLRRFIDDGGKLLIVSGRNRNFLNKVIKKIGRPCDVAGCNSAFIEVDKKVIKNSPMDNKKLCELLKDIKAKFSPTGIFVMSKDYNYVIPRKDFYWFHRIGHKFYQFFQFAYKERYRQSDRTVKDELEHGTVYKVMLFFGITGKSKNRCMEANRRMRELYPDFEFSWCGQLIEVSNHGCSKAEGIKEYLDYLNIKHDNVMVVGDSGNDISMFRAFKNSFCMSHATCHISKYANHVIRSVNELEKYINDNQEEKIYE